MLKRSRRRFALVLEELEDRCVPALLGQQLFPADNPWNQQITNAPVAANSAAIMNSIISTYGNGHLHPDFGQDYQNNSPLYGIPVNVVHGNSVTPTSVVIDAYPGESDIVPVPLPANPVLEGDFQNGPNHTVGYGTNGRGDSHLIVFDVDNNIAYEFYYAIRPGETGATDGHWHADQETVWNMNTDEFRTLGWTSADAAGLSILAGLARPDEGDTPNQGGQGVITHAIRMTLQNAVILDQFIYPASHVANSNTNAAIDPPMGARFRLKASVDISGLNPESKIIAQAMKDYGLIVADNGSNFYISGASYSVNASNQLTSTWDDNDIQDTVHGLKSLPFSDFEVVDLTPVVTGLSANSGPAGTQVTVIGQNFSGAAGHLQVFFGNTPATSVTVADDSHVLVTAPAGTGTVDVRVQSGVTTGPDSQNIESTIFGYGTSALSANDRFTYGAAGSTGTISGTMFLDVNADGQRGAGEAGLAGRTVFLDTNGNGVLDPGELTAVTNAAGQYQFPGLVAGTYRVVERLDPGMTATTASAATVTLTAGANVTGLNFGDVVASPVSPVIVSADRFAPHPNPDANTAFVKGLYHNLLGRDADPSGLSGWVNQLDHGWMSHTQVTLALWNSAEHRSQQVTAYFLTYLRRAPGASELASWVQWMQAGLTEENAVTAILISPEYTATHSTAAAFVSDLYWDVLGRAGDATNLAGLQAALSAGTISRAALASAFVRSSEAHQRAVDGYFAAYLHRAAGAAEEQSWGAALDKGQYSLASAATMILASGEYFADAQADGR